VVLKNRAMSLGSLQVGLDCVSHGCIGGVGWRRARTKKRTAVVFDAHVYPCVDQVGRYIDWFLGVDQNIFMFRGIVGCARGYVQHVLLVVRHACVSMLFDVDIS
jgi:hypothetical protein